MYQGGNRRKRSVYSVLVPLLLGCFAGAVNAQVREGSSAQEKPVPSEYSIGRLLIRSYLQGKSFVPEERAFQLVRLIEVAAPTEPSYAKLWAEELFALSLELPPSDNRLALQKNALVALAPVDPERAMELLSSMEGPVPNEAGYIGEDIRSDGARVVFAEVWKQKGLAALDTLRVQAMHLGDTGEYPYAAMAPMMVEVSKGDPALAHSLFGEALLYYERGPRARYAHEEFAGFLRSVWDVIPLPSRRRALIAFVDHVRRLDADETEQKEKFLAQVHTQTGAAQFHSRAGRLLFEILPMIREIDPGWAKDVSESHPELRQAASVGGSPQRTEGVVIQPGVPTSQIASAQVRGIESVRLREIETIVTEEPDKALALTLSLSNTASRAVALAHVAQSLASRDRPRAIELANQAADLISAIQEQEGKLKALVAVAGAWASLEDAGRYRQYLRRAFDLGIEVFQQDLDTTVWKPAIFAAGFDELALLTRLGVQHEPQDTLSNLLTLENTVLQAYLLLEAAESLSELQGMDAASSKQQPLPDR